MEVIVFAVILVLAAVAYCEVMDPDGTLRSWLWCRKHKLRLKEYPSSIGGGVVFWCGVDEYGDEYVPDARGVPRKLERKDQTWKAPV